MARTGLPKTSRRFVVPREMSAGEGLFVGWPKLAPVLQDWAEEAFGQP
jgi:hypothetical protein